MKNIKRMKKYIFIFIVLIRLLSCAAAEEYDDIIKKYTDDYASELEQGLESSGFYKVNSGLEKFDVKKAISEAASGKLDFSFDSIYRALSDALIPELKLSSRSMLYLIFIILTGAFLINLKSSEVGDSVASAGSLCIYLISAGVIAGVFSSTAELAYKTVDALSLFLKAAFPVIIMSMYGAGCIASTTVLRPVLAAAVEICVHIIKTVLLPSAVLSFAIAAADCLSEKIKADKFASLMTKTAKWILACMLTVFTGIVGIQSIAASSVDGLTVKLTKLAASNLVPVVGGLLSESVETVMNCSVVIKNSVGICGMLAVVYICAVPLLKIGINILLLRFTAAVMQPLADERIIKCISSAADLLSLIFAITASVAVMFIFIITIIINTGNSAVMLGR